MLSETLDLWPIFSLCVVAVCPLVNTVGGDRSPENSATENEASAIKSLLRRINKLKVRSFNDSFVTMENKKRWLFVVCSYWCVFVWCMWVLFIIVSQTWLIPFFALLLVLVLKSFLVVFVWTVLFGWRLLAALPEASEFKVYVRYTSRQVLLYAFVREFWKKVQSNIVK